MQTAGRESHVVRLLEHFYVAGPNGNHVCMVSDGAQMCFVGFCELETGV